MYRPSRTLQSVLLTTILGFSSGLISEAGGLQIAGWHVEESQSAATGISPPAVNSQPTRPDAKQILASALQMHRAGDVEGAIRAYKQYLELDPGNLEARSNLGAALAHLGRYQEAISEYQEALKRSSAARGAQLAGVRFNLALVYYKAGQIPAAAEELTTLVSSSAFSGPQAAGQSRRANLLLADCHLRMGENKKVVEILTPLESSQEEDHTLDYLLGMALIRDHQTDKGQVLVDRILREGDSAEARLMMGTVKIEAHDYPAAVKDLARAVELSPDLPSVHSIYGRALMEAGDREGAARAFRRELQIDPNDYDSNLQLGAMLKEDQHYEEAMRYFRRAEQVRPGDPGARYQIAATELLQGQLDTARQDLEALVRTIPSFVEAHVSLATVYYRLKRKEDGDRERAIVLKLNAEQQARQPAAQEPAPRE